jgi:hypothetical protein
MTDATLGIGVDLLAMLGVLGERAPGEEHSNHYNERYAHHLQ